MRNDFQPISETGNWNVASPYSQLMIMKWIFLASEYSTIAEFGTAELIDEFNIDSDENLKSIARKKGIERFAHALLMIIDNTQFALKKDDKLKFAEFRKEIEMIREIIPLLVVKNRNFATKTSRLTIRETDFKRVLSLLISINQQLRLPLNKADLIFTNTEEFSPDELKSKFKKELIDYG